MESEYTFLNEKQSIRESARALKKYGSTCNHVRNNDFLIRHELDKNDTLQGIALKYGCTTEQIRRINRLFAQDSLFLKPFLMIPIEKTSPYYPKDERPHSLPPRAASIATCPNDHMNNNGNGNGNNNGIQSKKKHSVNGKMMNNENACSSKSMDSITAAMLSPEEENKKNIDEFLCKIDSTIAESRKYVNSQKNIDFITTEDETDSVYPHRQRIFSLQQGSTATTGGSGGISPLQQHHSRNSSAGSNLNMLNADIGGITQGRRVQNSLQRLEQQQDEFFEL